MAREQVRRKPSAHGPETAAGVLDKNGARVADDPWVVLKDEDEAPAGVDIVVSLSRLAAEGEALRARNDGRLGVIIEGGEAVEAIGEALDGLALVIVQFASFRDGRGFSTARLLRQRYSFGGELRAVGEVGEDQIFFMQRCGFDAFEIVGPDAEAAFARATRVYSRVYQGAADDRAPAWAGRLKKKHQAEPIRIGAGARVLRDEAEAHARELAHASAEDILAYAMQRVWPGEFAVVSSFGAESAVLLHLAAQVDRAVPVIFLETDRHFAQTLTYRDDLVDRLGLVNVRNQSPDRREVSQEDETGDLWRRDPDACCALRKVRPLGAALASFSAWATGRKRFHGGLRASLPVVEHDGVHFKINPLAAWSADAIAEYMAAHDLPTHPLVAQGYPSIGCWPCTAPADAPGRAGRWSGLDKDECGIHVPASVRRRAL